MNQTYSTVADRIRGEVPEVASLVQRATRRWKSAQETPAEQDAYLESAALNLHGFYSGIECLFELIARHVEPNPINLIWNNVKAA